jgi:DNA-binding transcriptional LysR family regulator
MVTDRITISSDGGHEVIQNSEQGVQVFAPPALAELLDIVHRDDLTLMRCIGDASSIRRASGQLNISINTARTRLNRLEETIGTNMYVRDWEGLKITAEGRAVLRVANEIYHLSNGLPRGPGNSYLAREGEIRICVAEGLGTFWLTPRLLELQALLPNLVVTLDCFSDQKSFDPKDFDICIGFSRPEDQEAIVTKLATIHILPFASDDYLRKCGVPKTLDELVGHHCVQQAAPGQNYDAIRLFFGADMLNDFVKIRVSSSYSLFWAVASGVGIGALPTYIRAISRRVRPLDLPIQLKFELWASFSRSAKQSQPVRTAMDWLRTSFDPQRYPWFADEFVHPDNFGEPFEDSQIVPLFDHLIDERN